MYWTKQEQVVFDIILFLLVCFQISTVFLLSDEADFQKSVILVGVNLVFLAAMIPYAKWVWKTATYQKAFLQLVKHELIILGMNATCILVTLLIIKVKG